MLFFILGNPRSGTSMFRLMLNSHSQITVPPESGFALWFAKKYKNIQKYNENVYKEYIDDVFSAKKFETWDLDKKEILKLFMKKKPTVYPELVKLIYEGYANKQHKKSIIFGDKNNYYIEHVDELLKIFPEIKLIFIIRDGRDVAVSYKKINESDIHSLYKPNLNQNVKEMAEEWTKNANILRKFISNDKVSAIYIRYEDLLTSPEKTMSGVLNFLKLEYEPQVLEFYKHNDEPKDFLQWKNKTTTKIDEHNYNKYKKFLNEKEIIEYEQTAKENLVYFGYPLHNNLQIG